MQSWIARTTTDERPFYFNIYTRRSQWNRPDNFEPDTETPYTRKRFADDWYVVLTNRDRAFFWNKTTKQTQWNAPSVQQEEVVVCDTDKAHSAKQTSIDRRVFQEHLSGLQIDRYTAWESVRPRCTDVAPSLGESEKRKMFEKHVLSVPSLEPKKLLLEYFCSEFLPQHVTDGRVLWRQVESKMRQDVRLRRVKGAKREYEEAFRVFLRRLSGR